MALNRKQRESIIAGLIALVLVLGAVASGVFFFRVDMTQDKAFSISKTSRELFKEIPEQLRIVYYVSNRLLSERPEPKRVEDMLREYASTSRGKIRVDVVDPEASGDAGTVERLGILPQQYQVIERNQSSVATVYTGVVIQYMERQEILPVVFRTETLEYDLTRAIRKVVRGKGQVAEVLVGDTDKTWANDYKTIADALKASGWDVREAQAGKLIGDDVNLLLVFGNSKLDDFDLYPVNQYVRRGGAAFFAVKGVDVVTQYGLFAAAIDTPSVFDMLKAYGVTVAKELVLDPYCLTIPFQVQSPYGGSMISLVKYPHWISVDSRFVSATNPITSRFQGLDLFWPSPMTLAAPQGVTAEVLVKSSDKAWRSTSNFPINPQDEASFYAESQSTKGQYVLAAALTGTFPDAFAGKSLPKREGTPADWEPKKGEPPAQAPAASPSRIIVVSSADFATELMTYSRNQSGRSGEQDLNASFILSSADWLSSSDDIVSIRTRNYRDTRLNLIADPKAKDGMILATYIVVLGIVPLLVVGYGIVRLMRRRGREKGLRVKEVGNAVSE